MADQEGAELDEPACSAPRAAIAVSISASLRTGMAIGSIPSDPAAASNEARKYFPPSGAVSIWRLIGWASIQRSYAGAT
jgi:hypothetical protein